MTRYPPGNNRLCGFTLIELIVTMLVIAIIAGTSVGALVDFRSRTPHQVMQDIQQFFILAGDEASITGTVKGIFIENNALLLREFARDAPEIPESSSEFGDLINGIIGISEQNNDETRREETSSEEDTEDSLNELEDRGAFPELDAASWREPIYTLELPEDYQLHKEALGVAEQDGFGIFDEATDATDDQDAEPFVRFFPDGSVLPAGTLTIALEEQQVKLSWDLNGKLQLSEPTTP